MAVETVKSLMQAAQIVEPNKGFNITSVERKEPTGNEVLIKVQACGICHSDSFTVLGQWPGIAYPMTPGHEIVGTVEALGPNVERLKKGDRVGIGWHGGHCQVCAACRSGDFVACEKLQVPGISVQGGYAEYALFSELVCAVVPEKVSSAEAAPLMCAGVTTFNSLRHAGAKPGDVVAILGVGGLGHLGVQFASKMGFRTVAIARGQDKKKLSLELGANDYIDSESQDVAAELKKLGGAKVVLATVTSTKAMSPTVEGLSIDGKLVIVGAGTEPLNVTPIQLIGARKSILGWPSGTAKDSEECMNFCALTGIRPMLERFAFKDVEKAYERMMSGKARFRAVIEY